MLEPDMRFPSSGPSVEGDSSVLRAPWPWTSPTLLHLRLLLNLNNLHLAVLAIQREIHQTLPSLKRRRRTLPLPILRAHRKQLLRRCDNDVVRAFDLKDSEIEGEQVTGACRTRVIVARPFRIHHGGIRSSRRSFGKLVQQHHRVLTLSRVGIQIKIQHDAKSSSTRYFSTLIFFLFYYLYHLGALLLLNRTTTYQTNIASTSASGESLFLFNRRSQQGKIDPIKRNNRLLYVKCNLNGWRRNIWGCI